MNEFVNADVIARGLSAFDPDRVAIAAGRVMVARIHALARRRETFAFETTLASRSFAPWLRDLSNAGYNVNLVFLWLSSPDLAIQRVADRVRSGGHGIPEETIRRRYRSGLRNFFNLYEPLASAWRLYDGSGPEPRRIADRLEQESLRVYDEGCWALAKRQGTDEG